MTKYSSLDIKSVSFTLYCIYMSNHIELCTLLADIYYIEILNIIGSRLSMPNENFPKINAPI